MSLGYTQVLTDSTSYVQKQTVRVSNKIVISKWMNAPVYAGACRSHVFSLYLM